MTGESRLFVGLWLPDRVSGEIERALAGVRGDYPGVAWQPRARWHLTLAFLGDRDEAREVRRFSAMTPAVGGSLAIRGAGTFGPILWAGVDAGTWLPDLVQQVKRACRVRDQRRYRAHVTLARARNAGARVDVRTVRDALSGLQTSSWHADQVCLVRSTPGPHPVYETIARVGLPAGP